MNPSLLKNHTLFRRFPLDHCSCILGVGVHGRFTLLRNLFADLAESPLPLLKVIDGLEKIPPPKIGPQHVGDVDFGVGQLPK